MKNLIYQYWDGQIKSSCLAGVKNMKDYSKRIGCDHLFEDNPNFLKKRGIDIGYYSAHYGAFKPVLDKSFDEYDNILFCDTDVFAVQNLTESIFENFDSDIGICDEPFQPKQRQITLGKITSQQDELWAKTVEKKYGGKMPRTAEGLVRVFNSGVVLYSRKGIEKFRREMIPFQEYIDLISSTKLEQFYKCDQPYLHCLIYSKNFDVKELDGGWNSYIHGTRDKLKPKRRIIDWRNENTKFVHCQFPNADNLNEEQLNRVVNLPREDWKI